MNVTTPGSADRLRSSFAARPTATRSRERRSAHASSSLMRSPESARSSTALVADVSATAPMQRQAYPTADSGGRGPAVVSAGADPGQQPAAGLVSIVAAVLVAAAVIAAGVLASAAVYPPGTV